MKRLDGKVAIVFGAGPNIGGTIAHFFAREGARVVVTDVAIQAAEHTVEFIRSRGYEACATCGNAVDEEDVARSVAAAVKRYGRLDIIVNMAGKVHWSSVLDMNVEEWKEAILSFPTAGLVTTKHSAKAMIEAGNGGSIIQLLSTAAHFGQPEAAAYATAKAGLMNFARSAAMDLARYGIRVNTITPCAMEHQLWTKMKNEVETRQFSMAPRKPQYSRDDYLKNLPLGRFPRSADLANAAVFLASEESSCITGIDLPVDSGLRHKYPTWRPGDQSGITIDAYMKGLRRNEFGEETEQIEP
jgi:NAD(P)-dependent dehydrogenase (short-subunit alcohol dehydrogenase family)